MSQEDKSAAVGVVVHHHHESNSAHPHYGTFQGVANYPPVEFPQPTRPPGLSDSDDPSQYQHYAHGYQAVPGYAIVEGRPVREPPLPCCGIGIGWFLFIIGFFLAAIPWYAGAILILCGRVDYREKPGYVACSIAAVIATLAIIFGATREADVWPKKLEKLLRQQGFTGNSYRILYGDLKERAAMRDQAISKPMNFSNHIAPRVIPSVHHTIQHYGKNSFMWIGPIPRVHIMDPEQLKTVFSLINDYQKPTASLNPLAKLLADGL